MTESRPRSLLFLRGLMAGLAVAIVVMLLCAKKPWQFEKVDTIADFASVFCWWAALINLAPLAFLFATAGRWLAPLRLAEPLAAGPALTKGASLAVIAAMAAAAVLGAFRLGDSLWDDEEYSVRRAILGTYRVKDGGQVKLKELPWSHTFWYYTKPTNHMLQSILSRLSLGAWRAVARPKGLQLNETALRFPGYVAGLLGVGATALMIGRAGFPWAGALAAWLVALHPWYMRLAPEARGYTYVLLFVPLTVYFALKALENSKWRWWISLAAAEFLLLYAWPAATVYVGILNLCIAGRIFFDSRFRSCRETVVWRWLVPGIVAAMVLFVLMLPCIPQFRQYVGRIGDFSSHPHWLKNVGSLLLSGSLWTKTGSLHSPYPENYPHAAAQPVLAVAAVILSLLILAIGIWRLWRSGPRFSWLLLVFLLPGPVVYAAAALRHNYLYEWYVAFILPGLAALAGLGLWSMAEFIERRSGVRALVPATCAVGVGFFAFFSWPGRQFLLTQSVQPFRESVELTRRSLNPNAPENRDIITVATIATPEVYDPLVRRAKNLDDLVKCMEEADRRNVPLYANNGFPMALTQNNPDIAALLDDPQVFELLKHFYAIEGMLDRTVHRYRPGALRTVNLAKYRALAAPPGSPKLEY